MKITTSLILGSALIVRDALGTPVCGQDYTGSAGIAYDISCGQTYSGSVVQSQASVRRRTDWALGRGNIKAIRDSETSFQDCIASCDDTSSCLAASFVSGECTLLSSVTDITNADGAMAALHATKASSVLPSLGSSIAASVMYTQTKAVLPPVATTTSLSYQAQLAAHLSQRLSDNAPTLTGDDTKVYISAPATSVPSSSVTSSTLASRVKRDSSTCSATNVASNIAVIQSKQAQPVIFCETWNLNKPHTSSGFISIALPRGVSTACDCILSTFASSTTCAAANVQSNMAVLSSKQSSSLTSFCQDWIANMPHTSSPYSAIALPKGVTTACKCILAGASVPSSASTTTSAAKSISSSASGTTTSINSATTGAYVKNTGKRGLCYNDPTLTQPFSRGGQGSQVSWAYNWYLAESSSSFNPDLEFIPLLYNNDSYLLSQWPTAAQTAINNGATALMSMNEPDWCASGSACMSVSSVVSTYKKYMQPFAGKALLGAPAVTNAGSPYGLTYLKNFINNCTGCTIDFINLHWYSNKYAGATYFESYINSARAIANGRPIWITEFGLDSTYSYTDAELQAFLETVMPWMDQQADIARYAYFMDSAGILINSAGTGLSGTGAVFNSFVNSTVQQDLF